jgi:hypothetical protein
MLRETTHRSLSVVSGLVRVIDKNKKKKKEN